MAFTLAQLAQQLGAQVHGDEPARQETILLPPAAGLQRYRAADGQTITIGHRTRRIRRK